jgi:alanyl-tRNA synthetase
MPRQRKHTNKSTVSNVFEARETDWKKKHGELKKKFLKLEKASQSSMKDAKRREDRLKKTISKIRKEKRLADEQLSEEQEEKNSLRQRLAELEERNSILESEKIIDSQRITELEGSNERFKEAKTEADERANAAELHNKVDDEKSKERKRDAVLFSLMTSASGLSVILKQQHLTKTTKLQIAIFVTLLVIALPATYGAAKHFQSAKVPGIVLSFFALALMTTNTTFNLIKAPTTSTERIIFDMILMAMLSHES